SEDTRRSACRFELLFRFRHLRPKQLLQSLVPGLPEEVINPLALFAPGHDLVARKARIASQPDAYLGPAFAQSFDNPLELIERAAGRLFVRRPQARAEQKIAAEEI